MSQGDQSIANQAGAAFRADLNTELQALVSNSSGATAPGTTYAYQWWADTSTGLLKQRNAANSAWVIVGPLALARFGSQDVLSVAAHATTCDIWSGGDNVTLSGGAVTFTALAAAPQAGAVRWVLQNAAHVWTHGGGAFDIQGVASYTAESGDWLRIEALSTSTFSITIFKKSGGALNGQIKFPATQNASADANTLDDYEEGTWTPGISFGGGTTGITYSSQTGTYTKIGNRVFIDGIFTLSNKGSSTGAALITGLPFAVGAFAGCPIRVNGLAVTFSNAQFIYTSGSATITCQYLSGTAANNVDNSFIANTTDFIIGGQYRV
jgi:hypothetical protein